MRYIFFLFFIVFVLLISACHSSNKNIGNRDQEVNESKDGRSNSDLDSLYSSNIIKNKEGLDSVKHKEGLDGVEGKKGLDDGLKAVKKKRENQHNNIQGDDFSLKEKYKNDFPIGTAVTVAMINDKQKASFIVSQYSSITPGFEMKASYLQPKKGFFSWENTDKLIQFAESNHMKFRGHCLIGYGRMPKWFFKSDGKLINKEILYKRLEEHINKVVSRYKEHVYCWDVVNEAISDEDGEIFRSTDEMYQISGEEYIGKAFEYAQKADPTAKLFYNDYGFFNPKKRDKIFNLLKKLKDKGVPIHGVGMQNHLGIDGSADYRNGGDITEAKLKETINLFSSIGLEVQITELDVVIFSKKQDSKAVKNLSDDYSTTISNRQTSLYEMIFKVCRQMNKKVTGITLWGAADWPNIFNQRYGKNPRPYLFDEHMKPKEPLIRIMELK